MLTDLLLPTRRQFLRHAGLGFGSIALASLLSADSRAAASNLRGLRLPSHPPKAKAVIWLFMTGAPSQMDTWDYKPELQKRHGQPLPGSDSETGFFKTSGKILKSPFAWQQYGASGTWASELFPHLSQQVDEMSFIHSMHLRANNHAPACMELMCGVNRPGSPSAGAWITYGLGSENRNLPGFVVMHGRKPRGDDHIWSSGFLPKTFQGLNLDARRNEAIDNLARLKNQSPAQQRLSLDVLREMNDRHAQLHAGQGDLASRINSFELAYRMQMAAPEALEIANESDATKQLYGLEDKNCDTFARQCLIARRLVERGVRFVQIFAGKNGASDGATDDIPWDGHDNIEKNHRSCAAATDKPAAALLQDLKARGLLQDTLVVWGGEFGRTSDSQGALGRDHNPNCFTLWLAGGGVKGGFHYGATDEFGYKTVENKVSVRDFHATLLHLLGVDHESLTFKHNGLDHRLTGVEEARVIREIIA